MADPSVCWRNSCVGSAVYVGRENERRVHRTLPRQQHGHGSQTMADPSVLWCNSCVGCILSVGRENERRVQVLHSLLRPIAEWLTGCRSDRIAESPSLISSTIRLCPWWPRDKLRPRPAISVHRGVHSPPRATADDTENCCPGNLR